MMEKDSKVYIAGHKGLLGSSLLRNLKKEGYNNLVFRTRGELDLRDQAATDDFFKEEKPDYVFLAAARVGGIKANIDYPGEFIYDNLQIQVNVIKSSQKNNVKKLVNFGSNCIYPVSAPQPFKECYLLTGPVEPTNEPYAVAKLAGIKLCQAFNKQYGTEFISVIPASLFGPNDNFDPEKSHLVPAMIRKFHMGKKKGEDVTLWGTGKPRREIMYVDDAAEACIYLMKNYTDSTPINVGFGYDFSITEIADIIKKVIGFHGGIGFDTSKPDGIEAKLLDSKKINELGWKPKVSLEKGVQKTYRWFLENVR